MPAGRIFGNRATRKRVPGGALLTLVTLRRKRDPRDMWLLSSRLVRWGYPAKTIGTFLSMAYGLRCAQGIHTSSIPNMRPSTHADLYLFVPQVRLP